MGRPVERAMSLGAGKEASTSCPVSTVEWS